MLRSLFWKYLLISPYVIIHYKIVQGSLNFLYPRMTSKINIYIKCEIF